MVKGKHGPSCILFYLWNLLRQPKVQSDHIESNDTHPYETYVKFGQSWFQTNTLKIFFKNKILVDAETQYRSALSNR
jgi:hypothetical protein